MFAYLRSHHKRGSQPSSPTSYPTSEFRHGSRADWTNTPQPINSDDESSLAFKTNVSSQPTSLLSRLNEHEERNIGQYSYTIPDFDQESSRDTIHQAQSVAIIRFSSSMENIRSTTSGQSRAAHTRSGSYTRPSTSYTSPKTLSTTRSSTDGPSNSHSPRNKPIEDPKSSHYVVNSQPPKPAKTRLNLLNPMSLLSRRKSGQPAEQTSEENITGHKILNVPAMKLPDDYDPSIRGKVVHDFSAPRPRRDFSSTSISAESYEVKPDTSVRSPNNCEKHDKVSRPRNSDRVHTPVFTEHFDDDDGKSREHQAAVQAECLADEDFISRNLSSEQYASAKPTFEVGMLRGAFPARIDSLKPRSGAALKLVEALEASSDSSPLHEETSEASNSEIEERIGSERHNSSTDRTSSIPSRWASKASRFSFQTGGSDSAAQERLLEERHKQKSAAQGLTDAVKDMTLLDENTDVDDIYNDMCDDGGYLEEQIPGVNAEFEDEDELFNSNLASTGIAEMSLDRLQGTKGSTNAFRNTEAQEDVQVMSGVANFLSTNLRPTSEWAPQLPLDIDRLNADQTMSSAVKLSSNESVEANFGSVGILINDGSLKREAAENDDLYFDDGAIEYINEPEETTFNESIIDDFERPVKISKMDSTDSGENVEDQWGQWGRSSRESPRYSPLPPPRTTSLQVKTASQDVHDPMIDAYYSALADAANKAVAEGKFEGRDSFNTGFDDDDDDDDSDGDDREVNQGVGSYVSDGRKWDEFPVKTKEMISEETSNVMAQIPGNSIGYYSEYPDVDYDYDRTAYEDDIVAEANAEALANDDDGFYGQEFGFYAHAFGNAGEEEQAANGGFFGPRGFDGLCRSASGRNAVREPNLTPITERSEFSARNSYITLLNSGVSPANIAASGNLAASFATAPSSATHSSPNLSLTHLVHPYGFDQDDMTMSQLLRLRRGAFGGSSSSLKSGDTSGSASILDSVHSGPAANLSPLSAKAGFSSLSPSNSDSSGSSQVGPFYSDPQYQRITGPTEISAATQMMTMDPNEQMGLSSHISTHDVAQDSFAKQQLPEDPYYDYSDEDNAASESPTLTGINYPTSTSTTIASPPTSPISSFMLQPQLTPQHQQGQNASFAHPPSSSIAHSIAPGLTTDEMSHQKFGPYANTTSTFISTESIQQQQQPPPSPLSTNFTSQPSSFAHVHGQIHPQGSYSDIKRNNDNDNVNDNDIVRSSCNNHNNDFIDEKPKKPFVRTHRRNASSTTENSISVAYVRERDTDGADRWVLERRRTAEDGVMELVGREVISHGWI